MTRTIRGWWRKRQGLALAIILGWATGAQASSDALLQKLVEKGVLTQEEANQVREELDKEDAQTVELYNKTKVAAWIDEMKWYGDVRLRAEYFDNEDQSNEIDRWRYRLRLRLGLDMKFQDWAKLGVRLASGGDDPVSTNQSFQDTFTRKTIGIDLAYVTLTPPFADWISVTGGKMNNPVWQPSFNSPMQYDFDVTPEGLGEQVSFKLGDKQQHRLFANFGQFVLDEIGGDSNDPWMIEIQGGGEARFGEDPKNPKVKVTAVGGFSQTFNLQNMGVASGSQPGGATAPSGAQSTSPNRGNATRQPGGPAAPGNTLFYLDDFQTVYGMAEVALKVCDRPFLHTPALVTVSGEYIANLTDKYDSLSGSNITVDQDQTEGWTVQVGFGSAKKKGEWQVAYQYKYLEADATWDAVTDSDWGLGGTDRDGHVGKFAYNIREWWQVGLTGFWTKKISSRPNSGENTRGNDGRHLIRVQGDMVFKF